MYDAFVVEDQGRRCPAEGEAQALWSVGVNTRTSPPSLGMRLVSLSKSPPKPATHFVVAVPSTTAFVGPWARLLEGREQLRVPGRWGAPSSTRCAIDTVAVVEGAVVRTISAPVVTLRIRRRGRRPHSQEIFFPTAGPKAPNQGTQQQQSIDQGRVPTANQSQV